VAGGDLGSIGGYCGRGWIYGSAGRLPLLKASALVIGWHHTVESHTGKSHLSIAPWQWLVLYCSGVLKTSSSVTPKEMRN